MQETLTRWKPNSISLLLILFTVLSFSMSAKQRNVDKEEFYQTKELTITQKLSIKELFTLITKQTNYRFFYSNGIKNLNKVVHINVTNTDVDNILQIAFKNLDIEYHIEDYKISVRNKAKKKTPVILVKEVPPTISGLVSDNQGPLPGVNIIIKGTKNGTTTDFDGNFTLEANPEDSLVFSYMGFETQTVLVGNKTFFNILLLPSSNMLDEVIIAGVAAGTSKKKMSVSVAKIKTDAINMIPQSSVSSALSGKIAGVTISSLSGSPGGTSKIVLRGATNLTGSNGPMIIIDGVISKGSLSDINSDDIESIEVVKGAAAASLYGSDAGNGVIVITSKRGKKLKEGQISVTLRSQMGTQQVSKYLELANSHYFELAPDWLEVDGYTKYNGVNYPEGYVNGDRLNFSETGKRLDKYNGYMDLPYRVNNNLQKQMFTNGLSSTMYAGIGHRNAGMNMFLSFENNTNKGIVLETGGYRRKSFRANFDFDLTKKIKLSASYNIINTKNDYMGGSAKRAFNYVLMMEPDVDLFRDNADGQKYNYTPNIWNPIIKNPLYDLWSKESDYNKKRFLGAFNLKYHITDWVNIKLKYAIESGNYKSIGNVPLNIIGGTPTESLSKSLILNKNMGATVNFNQSWDDLDFKGKLSYIYENGNTYYSHNKSEYDAIENNWEETIYKDEERITIAEDYFAIASFVYKDRYIFDGLYRNDGSSLFGINERRHSYYRVSGAYRVSKDIDIPGIQELKLRGSYGTAGLRPKWHYQYETFYETQSGVLVGGELGNKNLKPARITEMEFGIDVSFLDRLYLETSYSNATTEGSFVHVPLLSPTGADYQWRNVGTLNSKTFEAMLEAKIVKNDNFNWTMGLTFDTSTNKITELDIPSFSRGPGNIFKMEDGGKYGLMYGSDFVHTLSEMQQQLPQGMTIEDYSVNSDGLVVITEKIGTNFEEAIPLLDNDGNKKKVIIGDINPDFRMGLNTTLSYKNFTFYTLWKWKKGGDIYNFTAQRLVDALRHPMMDQFNVKPENKKTVPYYKSIYAAQDKNAFWVEDGSYVRLNEASLYYNLHIKEKLFKSIKVGATGKNLLTFTEYSGYDPETGVNGFIYDDNRYPNFRTYSLSVELKF